MTHEGDFSGHLRVREATAEERKEFTILSPERDGVRQVEQALRTDRSWAPVVERFENGEWVPIGGAIVNAVGQMTFRLLSPRLGQDYLLAAIRAVIQYLRDDPLTVLNACVDPEDSIMAGTYRQAGFVFSERLFTPDRILDSFHLVLRQECPYFNVWI